MQNTTVYIHLISPFYIVKEKSVCRSEFEFHWHF